MKVGIHGKMSVESSAVEIKAFLRVCAQNPTNQEQANRNNNATVPMMPGWIIKRGSQMPSPLSNDRRILSPGPEIWFSTSFSVTKHTNPVSSRLFLGVDSPLLFEGVRRMPEPPARVPPLFRQ